MAREAEELAGQAERLRGLKQQARGVTFREIASAAGVSERQAQRWFKGESDIDGRRLPKLAKFLGTTPNYIAHGTVDAKRRRSTPDPFAENGLDSRVARIEDMLAWLVLAVASPDQPRLPEPAAEILPPRGDGARGQQADRTSPATARSSRRRRAGRSSPDGER